MKIFLFKRICNQFSVIINKLPFLVKYDFNDFLEKIKSLKFCEINYFFLSNFLNNSKTTEEI